MQEKRLEKADKGVISPDCSKLPRSAESGSNYPKKDKRYAPDILK